jgi:hypothetical protein
MNYCLIPGPPPEVNWPLLVSPFNPPVAHWQPTVFM